MSSTTYCSGSQPLLMHSSLCFAYFGTFHSSLVRVRRLVVTTIGTMVFIDHNNLINKSETKTIFMLSNSGTEVC